MFKKLGIQHNKSALILRLTFGLLFGGLCLFTSSPCSAFLYEVEILDKGAISKLSDDAVIERYIEVVVEIEASVSFHQTAGYTPKEYKKHKDLVRFRIYLIMEMQKRKLEIPKTDL